MCCGDRGGYSGDSVPQYHPLPTTAHHSHHCPPAPLSHWHHSTPLSPLSPTAHHSHHCSTAHATTAHRCHDCHHSRQTPQHTTPALPIPKSSLLRGQFATNFNFYSAYPLCCCAHKTVSVNSNSKSFIFPSFPEVGRKLCFSAEIRPPTSFTAALCSVLCKLSYFVLWFSLFLVGL